MNTIWIVMPILIVLMFLLGLIGQLVILPVIAFLIAWILKLPPVYFMGLVLVACCPGGSSSNVFSMLAKGEVALSVTLTALSSIMTLFTLPLIMEFVAEAVSDMSGVRIELPVGKRLCPAAAAKTRKVLGKMAFPALMILAAVFFLQYKKEIADNFASLGLSAALLMNVILLTYVYFIRRKLK